MPILIEANFPNNTQIQILTSHNLRVSVLFSLLKLSHLQIKLLIITYY